MKVMPRMAWAAVRVSGGTQSAWKKTHLELIRAAFDGIGYCANEDTEAIWDVIADIGALNSQGHMAHK